MEALTNAVAEHLIWVLIGACIVLVVLIRAGTHVLTTMTREKSRREIAAYVAEGSMSSEQGERLINADVGTSMNDGEQ